MREFKISPKQIETEKRKRLIHTDLNPENFVNRNVSHDMIK